MESERKTQCSATGRLGVSAEKGQWIRREARGDGECVSFLSQGSGKAGGVQKRETEGGKREKAAVSG